MKTTVVVAVQCYDMHWKSKTKMRHHQYHPSSPSTLSGLPLKPAAVAVVFLCSHPWSEVTSPPGLSPIAVKITNICTNYPKSILGGKMFFILLFCHFFVSIFLCSSLWTINELSTLSSWRFLKKRFDIIIEYRNFMGHKKTLNILSSRNNKPKMA